MVTLNHVEDQLKRIGCNFRFWGRSEVKELPNVLMPGETIARAVNGRYEGGFALLCVTDHRLLLIDHKPMFLAIEDVRFDMISEINYTARLLAGTIHIVTASRKFVFSSWSHANLRELLNYTQHRVMEIRQHYLMNQFQQPTPQVTATTVGEFAMQANGTAQSALPLNPYTKVPLLVRRRRFPKFY